VWDLDHELRQQAAELGIAFARAATPNADSRFARLAADLIDELRYGREPAERPARMPHRCRVFRSTAHFATPTAASSLRLPSGVQDRADRGHPRRSHHTGKRARASLAICTSDEVCNPIGIRPELTVMIASMWAAFSSTRTAALERDRGPGAPWYLIQNTCRLAARSTHSCCGRRWRQRVASRPKKRPQCRTPRARESGIEEVPRGHLVPITLSAGSAGARNAAHIDRSSL